MTQEVAAPIQDDTLVLPAVGRLRLAVGLLQGLMLYSLYRAASAYAWPGAMPALYIALVLAGILAPVLLVSSLGHLPRRALAGWVLIATVLAAALGAYDGWREWFEPASVHARVGLFPSVPLFLAAIAGFFIAHALVFTGHTERRRIASYHGYFDTAWKLGVQLGFSGIFVGVAWMVLSLGAALFQLVQLPLFANVLKEPWCAIPVTVFSFTAAMHITDVRPGIVRGIRSLLLTLMGWILPIATLIIAAFLLSLPFTGLAPLWATRSASALMLVGAAMLVVLINAAWQDGAALPGAPAPIRLSSRLACVLLLPLALLAAYALYLRVAEHGWTHDRIVACACLVVAFSYAAGYLRAALGNAALARIAMVNIGTSFIIIVVLLVLFSPLGNPQRLAVASQLARLDAGQVAPDRFDYKYLRFEGGRYGSDALAALAARTGKDAAAIHAGVARALALRNRWEDKPETDGPPLDIAANLKLWPATATLPAGFIADVSKRTANSSLLPSCLTDAGEQCDVFMLDLEGDARPEVVLVGRTAGEGGSVMGQDSAGKWVVIGNLPPGVAGCAGIRDAIAAGTARAVAPAGKSLEIAGTVLRIEYLLPSMGPCGQMSPYR